MEQFKRHTHSHLFIIYFCELSFDDNFNISMSLLLNLTLVTSMTTMSWFVVVPKINLDEEKEEKKLGRSNERWDAEKEYFQQCCAIPVDKKKNKPQQGRWFGFKLLFFTREFMAPGKTRSSISARSGIIFPVTRMHRNMKAIQRGTTRVTKAAAIYTAAVVEYLVGRWSQKFNEKPISFFSSWSAGIEWQRSTW